MINRVETFSIESEEFKTIKGELNTQKQVNKEMEEKIEEWMN